MEWPTAGEWLAIIAIIVTWGLVYALIEAGREQKKREKERERNRKGHL